jgi:hypothetical protein
MLVATALLAGSVALAPGGASAESLFDLFFGGFRKQQQRHVPPQANFFVVREERLARLCEGQRCPAMTEHR